MTFQTTPTHAVFQYQKHFPCYKTSRLFNSPLCTALTTGSCLPLGLCKGTVTGVWKRLEFPLVTLAHNAMGTGEFPAQMASNAENVSIWWRHHAWYQWFFKRYFELTRPVDNETQSTCDSRYKCQHFHKPFVVWTGLHAELYTQQIIIVCGSCIPNQA